MLSFPTPAIGLGDGLPDVAVAGSGLAVPTGIESIFHYGGLTFNDKNNLDYYRINRIDGLSDPDVRDQRELNPSRHGETALTSLYGGRTVVLTGRIEASNLQKMRDMVMALKIAFADLVESPLAVITGQGYARDHQINCRKIQALQITEEQINFRFSRDFMVTLRASDPRIFSRERKTTTTTFAGASADGTQVMTVTNTGTFQTPPLIVMRGPMTSPEIGITSWEGGAPIRFNSTLAEGQERWIDIAKRTIQDEFGDARFADFVLGSSWPELPSGVNPITFKATGLTSQSSLTFYHQSAWL